MVDIKLHRSLRTLALAIFVVFGLLIPVSFLSVPAVLKISHTNEFYPQISFEGVFHIETNHAFAQATPAPVQKSDTPAPPAGRWYDEIAGMLATVILSVAGMITWLGGKLFEQSVNFLVLGMGDLIENQGVGLVINNMWSLVRDICNLAFIFAFIFLGIQTIVDINNPPPKRTIASIIIGALLINFSLFFVKFIIDFSNFTAAKIYFGMFKSGTDPNLSYAVMNALGITSFFAKVPPDQFKNATGIGAIAFILMGAIFLIIAGFVFAASAVLLITRFVSFIMLMVFSPLLFAATLFPKTKHYAEEMWSKLISQAFFAPAYFFLIFVSIKVLESTTRLMRGPNSLATAIANGPGGNGAGGNVDIAGVFVSFMVAIFLLIQSLKLAQQFGIKGAGGVMNVGKGISNSIKGGVTSYAGRNTIGRASKNLLKGYDKLDAAASRRGTKRFALSKIARNTAVTLAGGERNLRGTLEAGKKSKFGGSYSHSDNLEYSKQQTNRRTGIIAQQEFEAKLKAGIAAQNVPEATRSEEQKKAVIEMERAVANASTKMVEEAFSSKNPALKEAMRRAAAHMSQSQVDALDKSTELSEEEKSKLKEARRNAITGMFAMINPNGKVIPDDELTPAGLAKAQEKRDGLSKANAEQLSALGSQFLMQQEHAMRLTSSQMDDLKKKLTKTEYAELEAARSEALKQLAGGSDIDGKTRDNFILKMKPGEMSKLPKDVLTTKEVAQRLSQNVLSKIVQDGVLNVEGQKEILKHINEMVDDYTAGRTSPPAEEVERMNKLVDWFDNNPVGKTFGR